MFNESVENFWESCSVASPTFTASLCDFSRFSHRLTWPVVPFPRTSTKRHPSHGNFCSGSGILSLVLIKYLLSGSEGYLHSIFARPAGERANEIRAHVRGTLRTTLTAGYILIFERNGNRFRKCTSKVNLLHFHSISPTSDFNTTNSQAVTTKNTIDKWMRHFLLNNLRKNPLITNNNKCLHH